jgi:hypothetical protein
MVLEERLSAELGDEILALDHSEVKGKTAGAALAVLSKVRGRSRSLDQAKHRRFAYVGH